MKKLGFILAIVLLAPLMLRADASTVYKAERTEQKNFPATSKNTLQIENKYGAVNITAWDKNEVSVTVTIVGMSSGNQQEADQLLSRVKIVSGTEGNTIFVRTEFDKNMTIEQKSKTFGNEINYEVKVPKNIAFDIHNKYGSLMIDECGGKAAIEVKYGSFTCPLMKDAGSSLILGYGSATIQKASQLAAEVKYSTLKMDEVEKLTIDCKYSTVDLKNAGSVTMDSKYDKLIFGTIGESTINTAYTPIKVAKVGKSMVVTGKYGSIDVSEVVAAAEKLSFSLEYTDVKINIPKAAFELAASNKYGKILYPKTEANMVSEISDGKSTSVKGTVGKGAAALKVNISNEYGNIKLTTE